MKLIKISSVWCPSCLIMHPRYQEMVDKYQMELEEYDYDMNTDIVEKYQVGDLLPVVIIVDKDVEIKRIIGEKSKKELEQIFENLGV